MKKPAVSSGFGERMMGLEPTTFCMASRRSSQLSYIRVTSILAVGTGTCDPAERAWLVDLVSPSIRPALERRSPAFAGPLSTCSHARTRSGPDRSARFEKQFVGEEPILLG